MESDEKVEAIAAGGAGGVLEKPASPSTSAAQIADRAEHRIRDDKDKEQQDIVRSGGEVSGVTGMETEDQPQDIEALSAVSSRSPPYSAFSMRKKRYIVFMTAWAGLFSPISANIYFPALNTLSQELKVSSELINLTLTSYMIFQGLSPTIFGHLSDNAGRRPAYFIGLAILTQIRDAWWPVLDRLPTTTSSSSPFFVSDMANHFFFWFMVIMSGVYLVPFVITFPETGRNVVGNGSIPPKGWNMSLLNYFETRKIEHDDSLNRTVSRQEKRLAHADLTSKRKLRLPNPLRTVHIILEKDVGILLLYSSLVYTAFYDAAASLPSLFAEIYGYNDLQIGLSFIKLPLYYSLERIVSIGEVHILCMIPFGAGAAFAAIIAGKLMDRNYRRVAKAAGITVDRKRGEDMRDFPIENARIQVAWPLLYVGQAALLCYGWVLEKNAHLAAPLILLFIVGLCLTGAFNIMGVLLIDLYPLSPATATAANNLVRCLMGAAGTAVIIQMINAMGRGWCFTFLTAVIFVTSPMLWVLTKMGPKWREDRRLRVEKHNAGERSQKCGWSRAFWTSGIDLNSGETDLMNEGTK